VREKAYYSRNLTDKNNGSAECANTQLSLFNRSVIAHATADRPVLCANTPGEIKRRTMQTRQIRGLEIASKSQRQITYSETFWTVPSQSSGKSYAVTIDPPFCSCPDFKKSATKCKHVFAVEYHIGKESGAILPDVPEQKRKTYKQEWHEYNLAQTNEKARFIELLYELCQGVEEPVQIMGRPRAPFADIIFAACMKIYGGMSGRRSQTDVREAVGRGLLQKGVHYNTLSKYLEKPELTPYLTRLIVESSLPLKCVEWDFAVDSSGFSTGVYQKWSDAKWGNVKTLFGEKQPNEVNKKDWLKVHICTGVKTNIITAVEVTDAHAGDSPRFIPLVNTTSENFPIQSVMGDKAYSAEKNLKLVLLKGGMPYIDFRSNATADNRRSGSVWKKMYHWYQFNQERFMECYHRRSNVETTFSMVKRKFGERLRSKTHAAQVNEVLCKVLCHNVCCLIQSIYELGIEPTFWTE
jgi:transposase